MARQGIRAPRPVHQLVKFSGLSLGCRVSHWIGAHSLLLRIDPREATGIAEESSFDLAEALVRVRLEEDGQREEQAA
ncbi:MAG: hypothetical protein WD942_10020 [Dehalococcoidia bacterium]